MFPIKLEKLEFGKKNSKNLIHSAFLARLFAPTTSNGQRSICPFSSMCLKKVLARNKNLTSDSDSWGRSYPKQLLSADFDLL